MNHRVLIETFPHGRTGDFIRQFFDAMPEAIKQSHGWRIKKSNGDTVDFVHSERLEDVAKPWSRVLVITCDPRRSFLGGTDASRKILSSVDVESGDFGLPPCEYWAFWHYYWLDYKRLASCQILPVEGWLADTAGWIAEFFSTLGITKVAIPQITLELPEDVTVQHPELGHFFGEVMGGELSQLGYSSSASSAPARTVATLPPRCATLVNTAKNAFSTGNAKKMQASLTEAMESVKGVRSAQLQLATIQLASDWTKKLFGAAGISSGIYRYSFPRFFEFLDNRLSFSSIQRVVDSACLKLDSNDKKGDIILPRPVQSGTLANTPSPSNASQKNLSEASIEISPEKNQLRITEISHDQKRLEALFDAGNYVEIACGEPVNVWQYYAAQALIGNTRVAQQGLKHNTDPRSRFYTGVASWMAGDEVVAREVLATVNLPESRRLLDLISKPQIDVLTQVPPDRLCQYVPAFTEYAEPRFRIKNIGVHSGVGDTYSRMLSPCDIHEFISGDFHPDFFLCREIEWQPLPPNLNELDCPVFGHTEDYDIHLQSVFPNFASFSRLITCGSYEWRHLSKMVASPVSTFPMAYGLRNHLPDCEMCERDIDLFLSGTIFHPYHPDKAKLVNRLLAGMDSSMNIKGISKFLFPEDYFKLLGRAKICIPYVRFDGAMPTRGLESLAMGNALILQKGCSLSAYFGEDDGVFTCDYWNGELPEMIKKVVCNWPDIAPLAQRSAQRVREEFSMEKMCSKYLRFLTVMATLASKPLKQDREVVVGKRSVINVGWTYDSEFYLESLSAKAIILATKKHEDWTASEINDFAREIFLFFVAGADEGICEKVRSRAWWPVHEPSFLDEAIRLLSWGVHLFPRFLALQFNLMRVLYHFGGSDMRAKAREMAEYIARSEDSDWEIAAMDDVMPWDFYPEHFNYRSYFDLGVAVLCEKNVALSGFFAIIRASSAHYAFISGSPIEFARIACMSDSEFSLYQIDLARSLASGHDSRQEALGILSEIAAGDILPISAWETIIAHGLDKELPSEQRFFLTKRIALIQSRIEK